MAYVPGSPTIEITATDPVQGTVFYTMPVAAGGKPTLARGEACLRCHQGPNTAGVPGIYVGSVIPGPSGAPLHDASAIITDHRTPFRDRWGGWYVTARRGEQVDRANATTLDPEDAESLVRESRQNLATLAGLFDPAPYLAATSDIVALMTFEHQTQMINLITRVGWEARMAARDGRTDIHADSALNADIDDLVAYMFFSGEAPLKDPVEGVSSFARTFSRTRPARSTRAIAARLRSANAPVPISAQLHDLQRRVRRAARDRAPPRISATARCVERRRSRQRIRAHRCGHAAGHSGNPDGHEAGRSEVARGSAASARL